MTVDPGFAVQLGREAADARMVDACTVTRDSSGAGTINEANGQLTPDPPTVLYTGPCEIQMPQAVEQAVVAGDAEAIVQAVVVKLPVTAETGLIRVNDRVHIDACTFDPSLPGKEYRVRALHGKSFATARRLRCEEAN